MDRDSDMTSSRSREHRVSIAYMLPSCVAVLVLTAYALLRLTGAVSVPHEMGAEYEGWDREGSRRRTESRVLLVHSYHSEDPWVAAVTRGVRMATSRSAVDLQVFYMDTKLHPDSAFGRQAGLAARKVMNQWMPAVVIAVDDNAQEYFAKDFAERDDIQFVFCGVHAAPETYGYPASNITGVLERPHLGASLDLLRRMAPSAERVALLSDSSPASRRALTWMRAQETAFEIVLCETPATFEQWQASVHRAQAQADVLVVYRYDSLHREGGPDVMEASAVMVWTAATSMIPIVGLMDSAIDDGAACGQIESGVQQGLHAGRIALEILSGTPAGQIPIVPASPGPSMVNLTAARKHGIRVPPQVLREIDIVLED